MPLAAGPYKAPVPIAWGNVWTGFYAGAHGGYGWSRFHHDFPPGAPNTVFAPLSGGSFSETADSGVLGGHVGFNYQVSNLVFGLEASLAWSNFKATSSNVFAPTVPPPVTYATDLVWIATITPRLGLAWGNWLAYGKGGLAAGRIRDEVTSTFGGFLAAPAVFNERNTHVGWTVGAGIEHLWRNHWVIGLEYNYYDLGTERHGGLSYIGQVVATGIAQHVDVKFSTVLARLSYKFGPPAAIFAKY